MAAEEFALRVRWNSNNNIVQTYLLNCKLLISFDLDLSRLLQCLLFDEGDLVGVENTLNTIGPEPKPEGTH